MEETREPDAGWEAIGDALVRFHDRLVSGEPADTRPESDATRDAMLDDRLRRDQDCLAMIERIRRRYGRSILDHVPACSSAGQPNEAEPSAVRTIGRFELVRELGRGGHGVVFLARDPLVGRDVALKVPRLEALFVPENRARFLREARAAGKLTHPNIVPVFEVQEVGPVCYIASEYCSGPTLRTWLAEHGQRLAPRLAGTLMAELAAAVAYAHSQGVLHRDLKPSNVLLAPLASASATPTEAMPAGALGFVPKLGDFGLAKLEEAGDTFSRSGSILGTPAYMAPEQAEGRLASVCPATDVYALGAMLYELLAGRPPFEGTSDADTLRRVVADEVPPLCRVRGDVSRDLEAITLKCLEKLPERRYATAAELAADLERFLAGEPTRARPLGRVARSIKWARRHPAAATSCAALALGICLALAAGVWHVRRLTEALDAAQRAEAQAQRSERELREQLYLTDMKLAHQAHQRADAQQAVELLARHIPNDGEPDLRGFLWRHLWWLCHASPRTLRGHEGHVYHVAFSADGKLLASGGADQTVRLWDVAGGQLMATLRGHASDVNSLAFDPGGKLLASGDDLGEIRLWNVAAGTPAGILPARQGVISGLSFTPDGQTLASGGGDQLITLWDVATHSVRSTLAGHASRVTSLAISADGKQLLSTDRDQIARLWDLDSGEILATLAGHHHAIRSAALSPDGRVAATAGTDSTVRLWSVPDGQPLGELLGHRHRVSRAQFARDGRMVVSVGEDETVRVWDVARQAAVTSYHAGQGRIWCMACSRSDDVCATAGSDGSIKLFRLTGNAPDATPPGTPGGGVYACHGVAGRFAAFATAAGDEYVIADLERPDARVTADVSPRGVEGMAVSATGKTCAVALHGGRVDVYEVGSRGLRSICKLQTPMPQFPTLDRNGGLLSLHDGARGSPIQLWEVGTGSKVAEFSAGDTETRGVAFSPDGRLLASAHVDSLVRVWNLEKRALSTQFAGHRVGVRCVAFSRDGRFIASGGDDATVRVWNLATGREALLLRHPSAVDCVEFCGDDPILATAGEDAVVRLWSVNNGEPILEFPRHEGRTKQLVFVDRVGLLAMTNDYGRPVVLWPAPRPAE
jgi:WD40 repeat protein